MPTDPRDHRVPPERLRPVVDLSDQSWSTTHDVPPLETTVGQERAVRALTFGLRMDQEGYNIYAAGLPGTGKRTLVRNIIADLARTRERPDDWCYLYNFRDPERPRAVRFPAGSGRAFRGEMEQLVEYLRKKIPEVFQSNDYLSERNEILERGNRAKQALFQEVVERGRDRGFEIKSTRTGFTFTPVRKGKPLRVEEVQKLDPEERRRIEEGQQQIAAELRDLVQKMHQLDQETESTLEKFNRDVAAFTMDARFQDLRDKYRDHEAVAAYLDQVYEDVVRNFKVFLPPGAAAPNVPHDPEEVQERRLLRYRVNLVVDNGETQGAPWVEEPNPTYSNLVGRIEKRSRFGTLQTDFTLVRAGSILRANGGYLILHVLDLLTHPFSWEALKKALDQKELVIEDIAELYGLISTTGLKPEPIPVDLKVVLVGNPYLYSLLQYYDEDFAKLFKVKADFQTSIRRVPEETEKYVRFAAKLCREEGLNPLDRSGVAELLALVSRLVEHQERLSLQFHRVANLIREAAFWSREDGAQVITAEHVARAHRERVYRSNLLEERLQEVIDEGVLMIDVEGERVGQVNGLVVYSLGDYAFGKPTRITSRTYLGRKGVINVDRESDLSGKTHSKGVIILSNYLGGRYAQDHPLSLSASLAFEQSYDEVDGDSASAAELIAILSSLSGVPVRQGLAVTGSINQYGELQPIGGVNEKIEGFFKTCRNRGLTGDQGVVIPRRNTRHLCLDPEVVEAVRAGRFAVYAVDHVDQALTLLTGMEAGERGEDGAFPPDTVNGRVQEALAEMHRRLEESHEEAEAEEGGD